MNKTIALPTIAARAAEIAGVDNDTATRFILSLFSVAEKDIVAGNKCELYGIGTFSRGENGEILFSPAKELADAVNAPFALFSRVSIPADAPANIFNAEEEYQPQGEVAETPAVEKVLPPEFELPTEVLPVNPTADEPVNEEIPTPDNALQEEGTDEHTQPANRDYEHQYIYVERRSAWPWIASILCLLVGFAGGYCYGKHGCRFFFQEPETVQQPSIEIISTPTADTVAVSASDTAITIVRDTIGRPEPVVAATDEPVYDTVDTTRFLTTIARDHYGRKDYWVFIYEANAARLPHPNRIHPGTRVLVPELGPDAATDSATRARARELTREIYLRYDL